MQQPLISVIIPVYRVEQYLRRCVDSVVNQTYRNIQIILVDDGSPDGCPGICDEYARGDNRVAVIHKENGGLSDARNAGIGIADGEYIVFVDSDDYVAADYVEYLYKLIDKSGGEISVCGMCLVDDAGIISKSAENLSEEILTPQQALEAILYQRGFDTSAWGKLYKARLFDEIRFPKGRLYEDYATIYKLIDQCQKVAFGPGEKYFYYQRKDSIMLSDFTLKKLDLIAFSDEMAAYISEKYPLLKAAAIRRDTYSNFEILCQMLYCKPRYKREEKKIAVHIRANSKIVLRDRKAYKKDKLAVVCLFFGLNFFKFAWRIYKSIKKSGFGGF